MNLIRLFARPPLMTVQAPPPAPLIQREEIALSPDIQMADAERNGMDVDCQLQGCHLGLPFYHPEQEHFQSNLKRKRFDEQGFVTPPSYLKRQKTDPVQFEDVDPIHLLPHEDFFFSG